MIYYYLQINSKDNNKNTKKNFFFFIDCKIKFLLKMGQIIYQPLLQELN